MIKAKRKKINDFILFLNTSLSFTPNYNDIKHKINEKQFIDKVNEKVDMFKYLKLAMYTFLVCVISIFTTTLVKDATSSIDAGDINPGKANVEYLEKNFDNFFAFGSGSPSGLFTFDMIIKSNLISDIDKEKLINYKNGKTSSEFCNIYLGESNGIDIVHIVELCEPYKTFTFNSNLDYSFNDVLKMFEEMSQKKIEKEFLYDSDFDDILKKETSGIIVSFKKEGDLYVPYYTMLLDEKIYVVNK